MSFFLSYVVEVSCISLLHLQICRKCKCSAQPQGLYAETLSASAVKKRAFLECTVRSHRAHITLTVYNQADRLPSGDPLS